MSRFKIGDWVRLTDPYLLGKGNKVKTRDSDIALSVLGIAEVIEIEGDYIKVKDVKPSKGKRWDDVSDIWFQSKAFIYYDKNLPEKEEFLPYNKRSKLKSLVYLRNRIEHDRLVSMFPESHHLIDDYDNFTKPSHRISGMVYIPSSVRVVIYNPKMKGVIPFKQFYQQFVLAYNKKLYR